ncbi:MAG: hypothetical protein Aureis2KO_23900 [Aureisphaera sp.]
MKLKDISKYIYLINTFLLVFIIGLEYYWNIDIPDFITYLIIIFIVLTGINNFFVTYENKKYSDFIGLKILNSGKFLLGLGILVLVFSSMEERSQLQTYLILSYAFYMITTIRLKRK